MISFEQYLALVRQQLYPSLRAEGFGGSGQTLRRRLADVIHIFNIQGSSGADRCYVNLGVHLSFLPTEGGGRCEPAKLKECECAFRTRLKVPPQYSFGWPYGDSADEAHQSIEALRAAWLGQGLPLLRRFSVFPADFLSIPASAFRDSDHATPFAGLGPSALTFARMALHVSDIPLAKEYAAARLAIAPDGASSLRAQYHRILALANAT